MTAQVKTARKGKTLAALERNLLFCKYCGARLKTDPVGKYCPTRNCQWQHGIPANAASKKRKGTK